MTVKYINLTEDYQDLLHIWRVCFPEDVEYGEVFLNNAADKTVGLAVYEQGKPVSMAFFIPCDINIDNVRIQAQYVYGVATLPSYRNRGHVGRIFEKATKTCDVDMLFLHPAQENLTAFYEKYGFFPWLYADVIQPAADQSLDCVFQLQILPFDVTKYADFRKEWVQRKGISHSVFDNALLSVLLSHYQMIFTDSGLALMTVSGNTVFLPEIMMDKNDLSLVIMALQREFPDKKIVATTVGDSVPMGMVLPFTEKAEDMMKKYEKVPFSGTMFDI